MAYALTPPEAQEKSFARQFGKECAMKKVQIRQCPV
jgi:hypothetical protein